MSDHVLNFALTPTETHSPSVRITGATAGTSFDSAAFAPTAAMVSANRPTHGWIPLREVLRVIVPLPMSDL